MNLPSNKPCKKCQELGRDKDGNNLFLMSHGKGYVCRQNGVHHKAYYEWLDGKEHEPEEYEDNMADIDLIPKLPHAELKARGIRKDVAEHFGVRVEYDQTTGEEKAYYYPIFDAGITIGYKKRLLPKVFTTVGSTRDRKVQPFGMETLTQGGKKLVITGGQDDMLAAYQMLADYSDSKYGKGKYPPNVTSLTRGENDIKCVSDHLERIQAFEEVILCLDQDEVGKKSTEALVKLLGQDKCKIMKLSEKDPNDMLLKGKNSEFISAFFNAKKYSPEGIVEGALPDDVLRKPLEKGVSIPTLPGTMDRMKGLRKGELTLVLAPAGVGKTTIMREVGYALISAGKRIVHVFLEEGLDKTQQGYIAIDNNVHIARYRENPMIVSDESYNRSKEKYLNNQLWINHWGSMDPDSVMDKFRYAASWGADFGILDHVSMVFSGSETTNERKEIDILLTQMAAFTQESGMHLIVVSHIKRSNRPFRKKEDYPYWETVASDAGRGSGAFEQLAHNIITLEVELLDEDHNRGRIRTRVAKNREWSTLGVGDVLTYNMTTGRISPETTRF